MRIAQIAPLTEAVPPLLYGGTERIVSFLTEELVALGHDVTLFASGDSVTSARLEAMCPRALRLDPGVRDAMAPHFLMLEQVFRRAAEFDVLHFHLDYWPFSLFGRQPTPFLTTLHGRLDLPELWPLYRAHARAPLVSISDAQRAPMPWANWARTIHHGLPERLLAPHPGASPSYLAFLGRIAPEKRVDRAIEIAARAGLPIRVAAKVDRVDRDYFEERIRPLMAQGHVEFIGEIGDAEKAAFLSGAQALLFPIDWPEPFGLVMIEAMACGTPVIAFNRGSVPEVVEDGLTGFVVDDVDAAVAAVRRLPALSRGAIRRRFEERFTARRMAEDYVALYRALAGAAALPRVPAIAAE
ncbi:glycosyltransferase family 4 protein [Crenalkalicoccus roseus]|uniref:glycosyltransferase family 4 protein n=1 Tax=Crenalkalicoccus roseus TaxID=1485588 RepID=UPI0010821DEF|nr:glycosyltransferase family 4 protein [Crenalkalicoccus roseus]